MDFEFSEEQLALRDAVAQARATEESEKGNFKPLRPANAKRSAQ